MEKTDILITGAAGSIGKELLNQLIVDSPNSNIVCIDNNESALFEVQQELLDYSGRLDFIVVDLANGSWLSDRRLKNVKTVYHAAAFKHVGLSQSNELYYFLNNVGSMIKVLEFAKIDNSELVLISTDKAVYPNNAMGATKRLCEFLVLANKFSNTKVVRFGNVLNSNGSVIPIFKRQIKSGGPVTVTTPNTARYFMSISEAVGLVLRANKSRNNNKIKILDMGPEIKIDSLARSMIEEAKMRVVDEGNKKFQSDIEIKYIGLRPGEKEHELLTYGTLKTEEKIQNAVEEIFPNTGFIQYIIDCVDNSTLPNFQRIDWKNGCFL